MKRKLGIGVDFGSDSARALLVDLSDGNIIAHKSSTYRRWSEGMYSDASSSRYRQHPKDYVESLEEVLSAMADACPQDSEIVCIGVDTTASTVCMTGCDSVPLAMEEAFSEDPDAMFILWKDHTAIVESALLEARLKESYSAENFWSKVMHVLRVNSKVRDAACGAVELCDFLTMLLTGEKRQSLCAGVSKQLWSKEQGYPSDEFFSSLFPGMEKVKAGMPVEKYLSSERCGALNAEWAERTGLPEGICVGVGNIDAHSGAVGAGCSEDTMVFTLGTSACVMAVAPSQRYDGVKVPGVFGQGDDIIVKGFRGFEMGMSSFGDNFAWWKRLCGRSLEDLEAEASALEPDDRIPISTDWFNGRRSPDADNSLTATLTGLRTGTSAAQIYYSLVESACFGIRTIVDHLSSHGMKAVSYVATGGIARKSPFVMQMLADVLGSEVKVSSCAECCALGAVINASVGAGVFPDVLSAQKVLCQELSGLYAPSGVGHESRYKKYMAL